MKFVSSAARRGFTLIELLVVIAIIGILSSVVLASLNTARNKGADAAVKSNLEQARAQAELFYDANTNSYMGTTGTATDVCYSGGIVGGIVGIYKSVNAAATAVGISTVTTAVATPGGAGVAVCHSSAAAWAAEVPLKSTTAYFCVDSTGTATTSPSSLVAASDYAC